jgi:hypothetical protein
MGVASRMYLRRSLLNRVLRANCHGGITMSLFVRAAPVNSHVSDHAQVGVLLTPSVPGATPSFSFAICSGPPCN